MSVTPSYYSCGKKAAKKTSAFSSVNYPIGTKARLKMFGLHTVYRENFLGLNAGSMS